MQDGGGMDELGLGGRYGPQGRERSNELKQSHLVAVGRKWRSGGSRRSCGDADVVAVEADMVWVWRA